MKAFSVLNFILLTTSGISADNFINYYDQTIWVEYQITSLGAELSKRVRTMDDFAAEFKIKSIASPVNSKTDRIFYRVYDPTIEGGALLMFFKKDDGILNTGAWFYDADKMQNAKEDQALAIQKLIRRGYAKKAVPNGSPLSTLLVDGKGTNLAFQIIKLPNNKIVCLVLAAIKPSVFSDLQDIIVKSVNAIEPEARDE